MRFEPEFLAEVLPSRDPPDPVTADLLPVLYGRDRDAGSEDQMRRSRLWTYAILAELGAGRVVPNPAEVRLQTLLPRSGVLASGWLSEQISVGFLDPDYEAFAFGLVIASPFATRSQVVGEIQFPRLDASFPLAVRAVAADPHAVPRILGIAAGACWAIDNQGPTVGFMTCRHAVAHRMVGMTVPLVGGGATRVERKAPPTIDAAFLSATPPMAGLTPLRLFRSPTAGDATTIATPAAIEYRSVVGVTGALGMLHQPLMPVLILLDRACQAGDSGSLVSMTSGEGVGIYAGEFAGATVNGQAGQTVGYAQHLEQAALFLDVTPMCE